MQKNFMLLLIAAMISLVSFGQDNSEPALVVKAAYFDKSPPLRDMPVILTGPKDQSWKNGVIENKSLEEEIVQRIKSSPANAADGAAQTYYPNNGSRGPQVGMEGVGNVNGVFPPDTDGDVGPDHYFQMINLSFAIYDKQGSKLYGPANNSTLWQGFIGPWTGTNDGDPIVLYDEEADRWMATQFAVNTNNGINYQLIAVSQTGDPLGEWYRYAYAMTAFNDYPKFSVWNDGYYASFNMFGSYVRVGVAAFERDEMLIGNPDARMIYYNQSASTFAMLPADFDGTPPPAGTPCFFTHLNDNHKLEIYEFDVDWNNTANSSFTLSTTLTPASYSTAVNGIPQPNTASKLDDLAVMMMYRLQYRNFGSHESMVVNHTISNSGRAAPRWYELRKTTGNWSIYQQGTYAPSGIEERWMGSIAMNGNGDIALGYSVSSSDVFPSIRYTGRRAGDPLGEMTIAEVEIKAGTSSQSGIDRWGDYSCMSVDPADDTTFWFTTEYRKTSGWGTYISSFDLGPLTPPTAYAGPDTTICVDELYPANGEVSSAASVMWTTSGDGFFQSPSSLNTFYLRGNDDIANGGVMLALTAFGFESGWEETDSVFVGISAGPLADAGNDTLLCIGELLQLYGMASNYDELMWTTDGDGSFSDASVINPIYTPGSQDIADGGVTLTLTATATEACVGEDSDDIDVTIDECTGVNEIDNEALSLGIRPNPNNGIFAYDIQSNSSENIVVEVLNLQGQQVFTQRLSGFTGNYTGRINIGANPKGIYYLRINNGQNVRVEKVLVQ